MPMWPLIITIDWEAVMAALMGGVAYCTIAGCGADKSAPQGNNTGNELTIPVGSYNQCETEITANGRSFHVLLDSGASGHLTFGRNHAKALGYDVDKLSFNDGSYESANGTGHYAKVTLREVRIGS